MDITIIVVICVVSFLLIFFIYAILGRTQARFELISTNRVRWIETTRAKLSVLLILCVLLSLASVLTIYYTHQLQIEKERLTILCNHVQVGKNDYKANLKSNLIYNQSTLKPEGGAIYTKITESIETNFSYIFKLSGLNHPANITIEYSIDAIYETPQWRKSFNIVPTSTRKSTGATAYLTNNYLVNISRVDDIFEVIKRETGTSATTYNLTINPKIHTVAITDVGTIDEYFNPSLKITFLYTASEGDHILINGLTHTRPGGLYRTDKIYQPSVMKQRYFSYAYSFTTFSALAYVSWMFTKNKPKRTRAKNPLEDILKKYEEIIFELAEEPSYVGQKITIKTLEDLVQLADGLGKPIFHSERPCKSQEKEPTHAFIVLDGSVIYEYTITAPTLEEKAELETVFDQEKNSD